MFVESSPVYTGFSIGTPFNQTLNNTVRLSACKSLFLRNGVCVCVGGGGGGGGGRRGEGGGGSTLCSGCVYFT